MQRQNWFDIHEMEPGVIAIGEPIVTSWLVLGDKQALLIDTGMGVADLPACIANLTDLPVTVVNSHSHWDHIGASSAFPDAWIHEAEAAILARGLTNAEFRRYLGSDAPGQVWPPGFDPATATVPGCPHAKLLHGGERFDLGGRTLEIIHAPGHSPGGLVLLDPARGILFSTDVAYPGPLYCQDEDADLEVYRQTMTRLAELAPSLRILYPCHDGLSMHPAVLPRMRDALDTIADGRHPDEIAGDVAEHTFDGFSVLVPAGATYGAGGT